MHSQPDEGIYEWIKSANTPQMYNIHKICSSENASESMNGMTLKEVEDHGSKWKKSQINLE